MKCRLIGVSLAISVLFIGFGARAETEAAKAFSGILRDLQAKSTTLSPYEYVDLSEKTLLDFIQKYPNEPEAGKAHLLLGGLYSNIGDPTRAAQEFEEYLKATGQKGVNEVAQARYMLGASLAALEKYDEAEKLYREILKSASAIDPRIAHAASADLSRMATMRKLKIGAPAVEISAISHEGKKIRLGDYKGKVVLLDFWAAWCNPCRMEMPNVVQVYGEFHKRGFEIIGVSLDSDKTQFQNFIRDNGMSWPQIYDGKGWSAEIGRLYAINSIPATYLIDKQGKIRFRNVRGEDLRRVVQQLLKEK